jgi:CBS domain containing-hemolysin-like protein
MADNDPHQYSGEATQREGAGQTLPAVIAAKPQARTNGDDWITRVLRAVFGWKPGSLRADLEVVLAEGAPGETGFSPEERAMLRNILTLRARRIEDVMVPRADIIAVQKDLSLGELVKVFENAGHSRLVVYDETLDDSIGMVHIRDLIAFITARAAVDPQENAARAKPLAAALDLGAIDLSASLADVKIMRTMLFVPPSMRAIDLLAKMQATRIHLALVIDEYGGADGLVSIEDIVELIVGDIADEHDEDEAPGIVRQADSSFVADARTSLEDVTATVGEDFDVGNATEDADTLGGYLVIKAGHVPVRGELVKGPPGYEIEVIDADPRRVKRARIFRSKRADRLREAKRREGEPARTAPQAAPAVAGVPAADGSAPALKPGNPSPTDSNSQS